LRNWIIEQNENATERKIAAKEKIRAAKEKVGAWATLCFMLSHIFLQ
jgi:hypothetical protein